MKEISIRDLREGAESLSQWLKEHDGIVVTSHGKPIGRLIPYVDYHQLNAERDALRRSLPSQPDSTSLIRAERDGERS